MLKLLAPPYPLIQAKNERERKEMSKGSRTGTITSHDIQKMHESRTDNTYTLKQIKDEFFPNTCFHDYRPENLGSHTERCKHCGKRRIVVELP